MQDMKNSNLTFMLQPNWRWILLLQEDDDGAVKMKNIKTPCWSKTDVYYEKSDNGFSLKDKHDRTKNLGTWETFLHLKQDGNTADPKTQRGSTRGRERLRGPGPDKHV